MSAWWQWAGLFAAGGCGACLRHALSQAIERAGPGLPAAGTLVVNAIGCLAIGALASLLAQGPGRTIALAGLLGGFTTYSAFALLTVELAQAGRWGALAWQLGLHVVGGALLVVLGAYAASLVRGG